MESRHETSEWVSVREKEPGRPGSLMIDLPSLAAPDFPLRIPSTCARREIGSYLQIDNNV